MNKLLFKAVLVNSKVGMIVAKKVVDFGNGNSWYVGVIKNIDGTTTEILWDLLETYLIADCLKTIYSKQEQIEMFGFVFGTGKIQIRSFEYENVQKLRVSTSRNLSIFNMVY